MQEFCCIIVFLGQYINSFFCTSGDFRKGGTTAPLASPLNPPLIKVSMMVILPTVIDDMIEDYCYLQVRSCSLEKIPQLISLINNLPPTFALYLVINDVHLKSLLMKY